MLWVSCVNHEFALLNSNSKRCPWRRSWRSDPTKKQRTNNISLFTHKSHQNSSKQENRLLWNLQHSKNIKPYKWNWTLFLMNIFFVKFEKKVKEKMGFHDFSLYKVKIDAPTRKREKYCSLMMQNLHLSLYFLKCCCAVFSVPQFLCKSL